MLEGNIPLTCTSLEELSTEHLKGNVREKGWVGSREWLSFTATTSPSSIFPRSTWLSSFIIWGATEVQFPVRGTIRFARISPIEKKNQIMSSQLLAGRINRKLANYTQYTWWRRCTWDNNKKKKSRHHNMTTTLVVIQCKLVQWATGHVQILR